MWARESIVKFVVGVNTNSLPDRLNAQKCRKGRRLCVLQVRCSYVAQVTDDDAGRVYLLSIHRAHCLSLIRVVWRVLSCHVNLIVCIWTPFANLFDMLPFPVVRNLYFYICQLHHGLLTFLFGYPIRSPCQLNLELGKLTNSVAINFPPFFVSSQNHPRSRSQQGHHLIGTETNSTTIQIIFHSNPLKTPLQRSL